MTNIKYTTYATYNNTNTYTYIQNILRQVTVKTSKTAKYISFLLSSSTRNVNSKYCNLTSKPSVVNLQVFHTLQKL